MPAGTRALAGEGLPCPGVTSFPHIHGPVATEGWSVTQQGGRIAHWCNPTSPAGWVQGTAQSAFQVDDRKSKRHFAQVTRAESDFQKPANTGEFIILQLRGTEPEDLVTVKNMQPYAHSQLTSK